MATPRVAELVAAGVLSCACATSRYTQSRIETAPREAKGRTGEAVSMEIAGLGVRVESLDRAPRGQGIPNLALRLVFEPAEEATKAHRLTGALGRVQDLPESGEV